MLYYISFDFFATILLHKTVRSWLSILFVLIYRILHNKIISVMKAEKFKVLLYLKKRSFDKSGQAPVMGRITINRSMSQFSLKLSCNSIPSESQGKAGSMVKKRSSLGIISGKYEYTNNPACSS